MLYYLFNRIIDFNFPGHNLMSYISFRAFMAMMTSLVIFLFWGQRFIDWLIKHKIYDGGRSPENSQLGERHLGVEDEMNKKKIPTMGGVFIIFSIMCSVILFCDLSNIYNILLMITLLWMGGLGLIDDYIKVIKNNKEGLSKKQKLIGQFSLSLGIALIICFSPSIDTHQLITTLPFIKANEFDYSWLSPFSGQLGVYFTWGVYLLMILVIIIACSNSVNLTDGVDGLAAGTSAIVGIVIGVFAWVGGNVIYSDYLNITYLPGTGEVVVFISAMVGALVGFLWYNTKPATVFMGDVGSLAIGGVIGVAAVIIRKELLLPILCGIFFSESLSVIIQTSYFKKTKRRDGQGIRVFKCAPLHHHYQKENIQAIINRPIKAIPESKLVVRFWIIEIILAIMTLALLKIR